MLEILGTIGFDWRVALANLVSFLIVFFVLKKYVFKPLGRIIEERQKKIKEGLDKAEQSENELLLAKEKAAEELKKAQKEAHQIISEAKLVGDKLVTQATKEATLKAEEMKEQAEKNIEKQKERMEQELLEKTAGLVTLGVSKILDEDLDKEKNKAINQKALKILKEL